MKEIKPLYEQLISMRENGCTDSDVRDFCDLHQLSLEAVEHYIANYFAPDQCKGCAYVVYRPSMPPCNGCRRLYTKDFYKAAKGVVQNYDEIYLQPTGSIRR